MQGEIIYATFPFFIRTYMLLMAQFRPSVTALLQEYWQWGAIICLCPSVPPDGDGNNHGKEWKRFAKLLKQTCHLWASWRSYSHMCSGKLFDSKVENLINSKEKQNHQSPESGPLANCEWQDDFIAGFLPCLLYQGPSTEPIPIQEQGCKLDSHLTPQRSQFILREPDSLWNLWLKMLYPNCTQAGAHLPRELIKLIVKLKGKLLGSKVQA